MGNCLVSVALAVAVAVAAVALTVCPRSWSFSCSFQFHFQFLVPSSSWLCELDKRKRHSGHFAVDIFECSASKLKDAGQQAWHPATATTTTETTGVAPSTADDDGQLSEVGGKGVMSMSVRVCSCVYVCSDSVRLFSASINSCNSWNYKSGERPGTCLHTHTHTHTQQQ